MASKRDLVEAHAFNRRRLVTAFVSGAPGGREIEPARPLRAVVGGLVLALLVVAGAAVAGYLRPGLPSGWNENTLVVARTSGARYVATGGVLYPVANTTSARLLVPAEDFRVVQAPDDRIATQPRGSAIGIIGAPDALPGPEDLVQSGWSSCVDQQGRTRLRISTAAAARPALPGSALLVTSGPDELFVVVDQARHRVSAQDREATLRALNLDAGDPQRVPGTWVDQFPLADDFAPLRVPEVRGDVPDAQAGLPAYGTKVLVPQPDGSDRAYVRTRQGLSPLSELASALYDIGAGPDTPTPVRVTQAELSSLPTTDALYPESWPTALPTRLDSAVACALLTTETQQLPVVTLAVPAAPASQPAERSDAVVDPSHGALVRAVSGGVVNRGEVFLVDATGTMYALGDPEPTVQAQLGYAAVSPAPVPLAFLNALRAGPELGPGAARQLVTPQGAPSGQGAPS